MIKLRVSKEAKLAKITMFWPSGDFLQAQMVKHPQNGHLRVPPMPFAPTLWTTSVR